MPTWKFLHQILKKTDSWRYFWRYRVNIEPNQVATFSLSSIKIFSRSCQPVICLMKISFVPDHFARPPLSILNWSHGYFWVKVDVSLLKSSFITLESRFLVTIWFYLHWRASSISWDFILRVMLQMAWHLYYIVLDLTSIEIELLPFALKFNASLL